MKKKNVRPQITWTNKSISKPTTTKELPVFYDADYSRFSWQQNLIPGSLWTSDFFIIDFDRYRHTNVNTPLRRLTHIKYDIPGFTLPQFTYMLYMGTIRVEEKSKHDKIVNVLRHTFFVDGAQCIVLNLDACTPVT